jgi:hypothetical protein
MQQLNVGQSFHLRTGKDWIVYAWLVNDDVYSVCNSRRGATKATRGTCTSRGSKQDITVDGVSLQVLRAEAHEIEFRAGG